MPRWGVRRTPQWFASRPQASAHDTRIFREPPLDGYHLVPRARTAGGGAAGQDAARQAPRQQATGAVFYDRNENGQRDPPTGQRACGDSAVLGRVVLHSALTWEDLRPGPRTDGGI